MSDRRLALTALLATLAILAGYTLWSATRDDDEPVSGSPNPPALAEDPDDNRLTRGEVARHDSRDDCWTIVDDDVYDLTDYLGSHPGGSVIVEACGEDATELFEERRRSDGREVGSGEEHSSDAEDQLDELQIGRLDD